MLHFHPLRVRKIKKETEDCVSITFDVPKDLEETFRFLPGQNLTIKTTLNGEELRRNYSICSAPSDGILRVAVKKVEGGVFSTYANDEMKEGDVLEVMPPNGKFHTELAPTQKKSYLAFAAGSGITPILSIIKATMATEPQSNFTLVFGNRNKGSIIFKEELENVKDKHISRFRLYHVLSRERSDSSVNYGRIDVAKMEELTEKLIDLKKIDEYFICGPEEMIFCIRDFLFEKGVAKEKVHFELFNVPGQKKSTIRTEDKPVAETGPKAAVDVKLDGISFSFDLAYDGHSILDAALKEGADLPYACKGGVCTTCKAVLREGEVEMDVNWGLEPDEVERGYILTCQAHPRSAHVKVDFDTK